MLTKKEAKKFIKDIALDIEETHGCQPNERIRWVKSYAFWKDIINALGYSQATKLLSE